MEKWKQSIIDTEVNIILGTAFDQFLKDNKITGDFTQQFKEIKEDARDCCLGDKSGYEGLSKLGFIKDSWGTEIIPRDSKVYSILKAKLEKFCIDECTRFFRITNQKTQS